MQLCGVTRTNVCACRECCSFPRPLPLSSAHTFCYARLLGTALLVSLSSLSLSLTLRYGSPNVWRWCTDIFDFLALSAIVEERVFCVHGGLSPSINTVSQIRTIDRKQEVPHDGAMCDLMWSDPEEIDGWGLSPRGAGYLFGGDVVDKWNRQNGLVLIARAHQLVMEGHKEMFANRSLVTVWSAPNYCASDAPKSPSLSLFAAPSHSPLSLSPSLPSSPSPGYRCGNVASVMQLDDDLHRNFLTFEAAPQHLRGVPAKKPIPDYFL